MDRAKKCCGHILAFLIVLTIGLICGYNLQASTHIECENLPLLEERDTFEGFRIERQQSRQSQIAQLNEIISSDDTDPEIRTLGQTQLITLLSRMDREQTIENLLTILGFSDVIVSVYSDSASVFLRAQSITAQQAAIILESISRETEISTGNVKIIPIN